MWKAGLIAGLMVSGSLVTGSLEAAESKTVDTMTAINAQPLPLHVGGKVRKEAVGYSYQWPGVYFEARFKGQFATLLFDDDANNFNVLMDGQQLMIVQKPGHRSLTVQATGPGPHVVRVEKRSETQYATGHFQGIIAERAEPIAPLPRQIEFIGDSLTVGYGNTSQYSDCTPQAVFETTNSQQGFGPIVAKHFGADYQINAFSGLGMVRNYGGFEHPKYHMPMLYPRAIFDDPTPAAREGWAPQVIVIGIGGNDFSTPVKPGEPWADEIALRADYEATYVRFVQRIRKDNPDAFLILTSPEGRSNYADGTTAVLEALQRGGETKIARLSIPALARDGCNGHPNTRDDATVAAMFTAWLDAHPDVWQGK